MSRFQKNHKKFVIDSIFYSFSAEMQGYRNTMEDEKIMVSLPYLNEHFLIGVFDGHSGNYSSKYAAESLLKTMTSLPEYLDFILNPITRSDFKLKQILKKTIYKLDIDLHRCTFDSDDCSGTTCNIVLITPESLICANVGDSRSIAVQKRENNSDLFGEIRDLNSEFEVIELSSDHKPTKRYEINRIINNNGIIRNNRVVSGEVGLAVSRALGDFNFKSYPEPPEKHWVTCDPDIKKIELSKTLRYVFIACDGIWDVFSNQDLMNFIEIKIKEKKSPQEILDAILDESLKRGSTDNMTAILAFP